jgi:CSLREA domain-containing protein
MNFSKLRKRQWLLWPTLLCLGAALMPQHNFTASASQSRQLGAKVITRRDAGRDPRVNLSDGFNLPADFATQSAPVAHGAEPTALAAGDFDEDGVLDVVSGYGNVTRNLITLQRGVAAPQSAIDGSMLETPFLVAGTFELPATPDFLSTGDFNGDGHQDIVTAARGGATLYLLPGDGRAGFGAVERIELPGQVTALLAGEINRVDVLEDVIVGVEAGAGALALVFESPSGALRGQPEPLRLPAVATALALGQLDEDYFADLALAAGNELIILHGRDRRLSLAAEQQQETAKAKLTWQSFSARLTALAVGDFVRETQQRTEIALQTEDGALRVLARQLGKRSSKGAAQHWKVISEQPHVSASRLVAAKVSSLPTDELIALDAAGHQLHVLLNEGAAQRVSTAQKLHLAASLEADSAPVAVLPLHVNGDALSDLLVLRQGQSAPALLVTVAAATLTVNSTADTDDGVCSVANCTLREAIQAANINPGADTIVFDLDTPLTQSTINLTSALPSITDPVTLNGNVQGQFGQFRIQLNGANAGSSTTGLKITAGNSALSRLVINRFGEGGIEISGNGGNVITDCRIGTDPTGNQDLGNGGAADGNGIFINGSSNNTVGGTISSQRNVISGNGRTGITITVGGTAANPLPANNNRVRGNYIGVNVNGTQALGNEVHGVVIIGGSLNTIGGSTATPGTGVGNLISGNGLLDSSSGVGIVSTFLPPATPTEASNNLVQGNLIGTDATGATALGNGMGVSLVELTKSNTIGGTAASLRNIISGNVGLGVFMRADQFEGENNLVQGNRIGTNKDGLASLGNGLDGVLIRGRRDETIGGAVLGARNLISGNGASGVLIGVAESDPLIAPEDAGAASVIIRVPSTNIQVQGNFIGTNVNGTAALPNVEGVRLSEEVHDNLIGGPAATPGTPPGNLISGNTGIGIFIEAFAQATSVQGNLIGTNASGTAALENAAKGILVSGSNNTIGGATPDKRNVISGNGNNGIQIGGSFAMNNLVQGNFIGTDINGTGALGNSGFGVILLNTANPVGGTVSGAGNVIAFNGASGVSVQLGTGNTIRGNSIFSNTELGIDLLPSEVTPNDEAELDQDTGANELQNFPVLTLANSNGTTTSMRGRLTSKPNISFVIEVFANPTCHSSGHGEGKTFLGSLTVTTGASGSISYAASFPIATPVGHVLTATATDPNGNTSEFSLCKTVQ